MRNYPPVLNTKEDYEYVRANFPKEQWKKDWQNLLDSMYVWLPEKAIAKKEDGVEDETHKVVEMRDNITEEVTYTQYVRQVNPLCKLLKLGFTQSYVEEALQ